METKTDNQATNGEYFLLEDILDAQTKGGAGLKVKPYDPDIFWNGVGDRWYKMFDKREKFLINVKWIIDRLKIIQPIDTLLDVGCGFGRVLPFLIEAEVIKKAVGIDISNENLKCASLYLDHSKKEPDDYDKLKTISNNPEVPENVRVYIAGLAEKAKPINQVPIGQAPDYRDRIDLRHGDARRLKFGIGEFDCVLSNEILQHLNPLDSNEALSEMIRVTKKYILLCERWAFPGEHSESHIWSHNIEDMVSGLGAELLQVTTVGPGMQGILIEKRG